jgi:hypothetical protein
MTIKRIFLYLINQNKIMHIKQLLFAALCFVSIIARAQGFGEQQLFNDGWRFHLGDIQYGGRENLDISSWDKVTLPHDWSVLQMASPQYAACTGFLPGGIAWYRKDFTVPAERKGEKIYIYFEGVYNNSEVFINGKWLGIRPNGYISFMYDMTPYIKFGETNSIAVRVDHSEDADSRWYTGSGIYRNVRLIYANPVHINLWGVFYSTQTQGNSSTISVTTTVKNATEQLSTITVSEELLDAEGKRVASTSGTLKVTQNDTAGIRQNLKLSDAHLWSIDDPYLYKLVTKIFSGSKQIDSSSTVVGIRTLTFDADKGFALNGNWLKLKGVCIHHDAGALGSAVPKEVWLYRLKQLKLLGCNAIRMSHNPESNELFEACDELGFVVMAEAFDEWEYPKNKWIKGWNEGEPGHQGSYKYFREWGQRDVQDMVLRDRNHPSIIMWSIGNEVDYPNDPYSHPVLDSVTIHQQQFGGYLPSHPRAELLGYIAKDLVAVVKRCDTSRPVTAALAGVVMSNHTDYPGALDIVGYNYTEDKYAIDHKQYPKRVLFGSETSSGLASWKAVRDNPYIFGQFIWSGYDYLGESRGWPARGFTSGLIDFSGRIKPRGYFQRSLWSVQPVAYLGTYPVNPRRPYSVDASPVWNYEDSQMIRVVCYSNCDEAELLLNGKVVGQRQKQNDETAVFGWDVPYSAGTLEVKAYQNNQVVATDTLQTVGVPTALEARLADGNGLDKQGLAQVLVNIVDSNGRPVIFAENTIRCDVIGDGEVVAIENGKQAAYDNYRSNVHSAWNGNILVYVKANSPSGSIELKAISPLLKSMTIKLR